MDDAAEPAPHPRGVSPLGLAVLALWLGLGAALLATAKPPHVLLFAFVMIGWMLSVMAHEFGHALVGWLGGDHTVRIRGYLDFDPRRYADPVTSLGVPLLALALGGIGFPGGAVYLRTDLMRSRMWRAGASLAGPAMTAGILLLLVLALRLWAASAPIDSELFPALSVLAFLQAMALVLNLLPIPGLDGFNAIRPFLPQSWAPALRKVERLGMLLLLAVVFLLPGAGGWLFGVAARLCLALGLNGEALQYGWSAFFFWRR